MRFTRLQFKVATEESEFQQIARLNYLTFVREIPQHPEDDSGSLVDRFHLENRYLIALRDADLVGMLALRGRRPFSLDLKLQDLDRYLPEGRRPCEIRLLSIVPHRRHGLVLHGLLRELVRECDGAGYDLALISASVPRLSFYKNLGFLPFGPRVGASEAEFQPMSMTLQAAQGRLGRYLA